MKRSLATRLRHAATSLARRSPFGKPRFIAAEVEIVKLDPAPARVGAPVAVICRITNTASSEISVNLVGSTDMGQSIAPVAYTVPDGQTIAVQMTASWSTTGTHSVTAWLTQGASRSSADTVSVVIYEFRADVPTATASGPSNIGVWSSSAGVVHALAGRDELLFCVSEDAGIWRSAGGGAWTQIPLRAICVAVDPANSNRVVAGDREGDAPDARLESGGLHEATDGGITWRLIWDPFPTAGSHLVRELSFDPRTGTLFIATQNGVARLASGSAVVEHAPGGVNAGAITALAPGDDRMWARTVDTLLFSQDDGVTWTSVPIPTTIDVPPIGTGFTVLLDGSGDENSLAAFGNTVVLSFTPIGGTASFNNQCSVIVLDVAKGAWHAQLVALGNGTGNGGRRFVKLFRLSNCSGYPPGVIGQSLRLYYCAAQDIVEALSFDASTSSFTWDTVAVSASGSTFHSDIWDLHVSDTFCPPTNRATIWVACDGGVFQGATARVTAANPTGAVSGLLPDYVWTTRNAGLFTHHAHSILALQPGAGQPTILLYPTHDNGPWARRDDGTWVGLGTGGDANYAIGDVGMPCRAVTGRSLNAGKVCGGSCSAITDFSDLGSGIALTPCTVDWDAPGGGIGRAGFQVIPTLPTDDLASNLDVVLLTDLPLHSDAKGTPLTNPPAWAQGSGLVLIRNTHMQDHPDGPASNFQDWAVEVSDVPAGSTRVWVTGGRSTPQYYFVAPFAGGAPALFKRDITSPSWNTQPIVGGLLDAGSFGAAFINPYDARYLYVVATDSDHPNGVVKRSTDGGMTFEDEEVLTALVTASGEYRFGEFQPAGAALGQLDRVAHSNGTSALSQIVFMRSNPNLVAVMAPFVGVFFRNYASGCTLVGTAGTYDQAWKDLTPSMPGLAYPVGGALDAETTLYVATEGRSIFSVTGTQHGAPATFFAVNASMTTPAVEDDAPVVVATLLDANGASVPFGTVNVTARRTRAPSQYDPAPTVSSVLTDAEGRVAARIGVGGLSPGSHQLVVLLQFQGDGTLAPSRTAFVCTVTVV